MFGLIEVEKTVVSLSVDPVALLALLVAAASLIVSIVSIVRDKPKVKIKIKTGWTLVNPAPGYKRDTPYVSVSVINSGIRPVTIASVGGKHLWNTGGFIMSDSMIGGSKELTQGKRMDCLMEESSYNEILEADGILRIEAEDLTGKVYVKNVAPFYLRGISLPVRAVRTALWNARHNKDKKSKK